MLQPSEGFQLYLEVLDDDIQFDGEDANELVDRFVFDMTLIAGAGFSVENDLGMFEKATLKMDVFASCSSGYQGLFCSSPPMQSILTGVLASVGGVVLTMIIVIIVAVIVSCLITRFRSRRKLKKNVSLTTSNIYNHLVSP